MKALLLAALVVLVLLLVAGANGVFLEEPSQTIVAENDTAVFRCRVSIGALAWVVNGTDSSILNNPDIQAHTGTVSRVLYPVNSLCIVAKSVYNGTAVQCQVLYFSNNSSQAETLISAVATLLIQGPLAAVTDLTAEPRMGFILFLWGAPFSLNLTNNNTDIEPESTYCVDVWHSSTNKQVATECRLPETSYNFYTNEMGPCDLFTAVVTPVNGAGNGSSSDPVNGTFFDAPVVRDAVVSEVEFLYGEDETITTVHVSVDFKTIVYICTCIVTINTTDGRDPTNGTTVVLKKNTGKQIVIISFNDTFPDRNWSMDILLKNSAGSTTTDQMHLSTHDVQEIIPVSDSPRGVEFNVKFATNSRALGCVVILKSGSMEAVFVKYRDIDSTSDQFTVTGLPPTSYDMAGFDLEGSSGLPGNYSAVNAPLESRETDSQPLGVEGAVMAKAVLTTPTDGAICVKCTIPARGNATECVFITHPTESLEEIKTVVLTNGDEHCILDPSSQQYSVASFGRLESRIVSLSNAPGHTAPTLLVALSVIASSLLLWQLP